MSKHDNSSRLFANNWLEATTHVHPITPLFIWAPVVGYFLYEAAQKLTIGQIVIWAPIGLFAWTLSEYFIHRNPFHYEAQHSFGKNLVFMMHGIHHKESQDPTRLVMPPAGSIIILGTLFLLFDLFLGPIFVQPFFAFFVVGYLCYDYIHYATHQFPCKSSIMEYLQYHHMIHHHVDPEKRYGISSPLWDIVFNTYRIERTP